jgi:hypothetical protein
LGGFGRKKQAEPKPEPVAQQQAPAETASAGSAPGTLLEMQTEMSGFSQTADASLFEVPAGFKKVDSDMKKLAR